MRDWDRILSFSSVVIWLTVAVVSLNGWRDFGQAMAVLGLGVALAILWRGTGHA